MHEAYERTVLASCPFRFHLWPHEESTTAVDKQKAGYIKSMSFKEYSSSRTDLDTAGNDDLFRALTDHTV
jgi:hypothetical protein